MTHRTASFSRSLRQAGFTLIEMSVVLVIVALIIGGILVGQELAHGAEVNSVVTDANRIKTGVANFRMKYNAWPGDMKNATGYWSTTTNGNGDGYVDWTSWTAAGEFWMAWQHLALSGILPGNYTGTTASTTDIASSVIIDGNMLGNKLSGFYGILRRTDALHDGNGIYAWGGNPNLFAMNASDARSIDLKLDDGKPGTGVVSAIASAANCSTGTDLRAAQYNVAIPDIVCSLMFWFD